MTSYQHHGAGPLSRRLVLGLLGSIPVAAGAAVATGGSVEASMAATASRRSRRRRLFSPGGLMTSSWPGWPLRVRFRHAHELVDPVDEQLLLVLVEERHVVASLRGARCNR